MSRGSILYVEDDPGVREVMAFNLREANFEIDTANDGAQAFSLFEKNTYDLVLSDIKMPNRDGVWLLKKILEKDPKAIVIMLTAFGGSDRAVETMRLGAYHYVEKPVNLLTLIEVLDGVFEKKDLSGKATRIGNTAHLIASSPAMNRVLQRVDKIAKSDAAILLRGDSGTGKELIARTIHERSSRSNNPFIAVNCAAIPADLLESILFGHKKGAFTGAEKDSEGKFMAANEGSIFLDEIGEMSSSLQAKLLRVLQDGYVDVVGSTQPYQVDVRIISATHQNLEEKIEDGSFRTDLFYRLNVVPILVPALKDRKEDIPVLLRHFVRLFTKDDIEIDPAVEQWCLNYDWPGNVRELSNLVQRMILLRSDNHLGAEDLPPIKGGNDDFPFVLPDDHFDLVAFEKALLSRVMQKTKGNQSAAARYLKIPRHVLIYRLDKYGIEV